MRQECGTCRFICKANHVCKLRPPANLPRELDLGKTRWPLVTATDWCGQWQEPLSCDECGDPIRTDNPDSTWDFEDAPRWFCSESCQARNREPEN